MAQQTERFSDMLEYVNKFVMEKQELTYDERTVVSTAYKNITGNKRAGSCLRQNSGCCAPSK
jgi:14-3-3 protein epsilon